MPGRSCKEMEGNSSLYYGIVGHLMWFLCVSLVTTDNLDVLNDMIILQSYHFNLFYLIMKQGKCLVQIKRQWKS